jgi:hypothetical protein
VTKEDPHDTIKIDHESLRAAKQKYRMVVIQLEERRHPDDVLHPAYKLGQFLTEALGSAWADADEKR